jgi:acyl-coenzyme A synthetase/AMP-(fatty) acid ligase
VLFIECFAELLRQHDAKKKYAILSSTHSEKLAYSYGDCENDSNRFARFGLQRGLKVNDILAFVNERAI